MAASLDGYIATPDGGVDWLSAYNSEGEDDGYSAYYESVDALIEGRRTYEKALEFGEWPHPGKPCWVCTQRAQQPIHPEVRFTSRAPEELVAELSRRRLRRVWLVGGAQLAASFRNQRMIDKYIVSVVPIVLGSGIPLFDSPGPQENLRLVECKRYQSGLVQLSYARDGDA